MHSHSLRTPYDDPEVLGHGPPPVPGYGGGMRAPRKQSTMPAVLRVKGGGALPWTLLLLVLAGAGLAAYVGYEKYSTAEEAASSRKQDLQVALARAADAEKQVMLVQADLDQSKDELQASATELQRAQAAAADKEKAASELEGKLRSLLEEGQGEVIRGKDGQLTLQLVDKVLFKSGESELTPRGQRVMARVGKALLEMADKQVWVQGHTDDVPIKKDNERFASNWELSAARALTVVHYLQDEAQVDPKRLAAAAFGSYRPVSKRKKARNRRIEIVLFPREVELER